MARAIFISYRRADAEGEAGRLFDDLVRTFGDDSVFMDVAGISPGLDFRKAIDDNVATCGVLLAVIGPHWVTATDREGKRRIDDENDFVRLETSSALARNIPVVPVLVHGATMPHPDELPENLKGLAYRNSVEITHPRWNSDVQLLTTALRKYVGQANENDTKPVHATVPVQLPPPVAPVEKSNSHPPSRRGVILGGSAAAVLLVGAVGFFALHRSPSSAAQPAQIVDEKPSGPAVAPATKSKPAVRVPPTVNGSDITVPVANSGGGATNQPVSNSAPVPGIGSSQPTKQPTILANPVLSAMIGHWTNASRVALDLKDGSNNLSELQIRATGNRIMMTARGCASCDWGPQLAEFNGQAAIATWNVIPTQPGRVSTLTVSPEGQRLAVQIVSTFPDNRQVTRKVYFDRSP